MLESTSVRQDFLTDGLKTHFAFTIPFLNHERFYVKNESGELLTGYTVVPAAKEHDVYPGGTLVFQSPPPVGRIILIRSEEYTQETVYQTGGALPAKSIEGATDKLTMLVQQLIYLYGRCASVEDEDTKTGKELTQIILESVDKTTEMYNKMKKIIDEWSGQAGDIQYEVQGDSDVPVPEDPGITGLGYDVLG